jgi:hypothetical protein
MSQPTITPIDPDSPAGRELATSLSAVLAEIEWELAHDSAARGADGAGPPARSERAA